MDLLPWAAIMVSIHAPRAGRDQPVRFSPAAFGVSIHAPRAGRDQYAALCKAFLTVSIHAPRAGRDITQVSIILRLFGFNPRAPRGARRDGTKRKE